MDDWKKKPDSFWREKLSPDQYAVCRQGGTERPFSGKFTHSKEPGDYLCAGCNIPLFRSDEKYDSGSGWPSYWAPIESDRIQYLVDKSHGMIRTEIRCARCSTHLGHVFEDGPEPTRQRFCVNSLSLVFEPRKP